MAEACDSAHHEIIGVGLGAVIQNVLPRWFPDHAVNLSDGPHDHARNHLSNHLRLSEPVERAFPQTDKIVRMTNI
jgi:hypothetical protein